MIIELKLPVVFLSAQGFNQTSRSRYSTFTISFGEKKLEIRVCGALVKLAGELAVVKLEFWSEDDTNCCSYAEMSIPSVPYPTHKLEIFQEGTETPDLRDRSGHEMFDMLFMQEDTCPHMTAVDMPEGGGTIILTAI